jgi:phage-related tail fiber protein
MPIPHPKRRSVQHRLQQDTSSSKTTIQGNLVATTLSHVVQAFRQDLWADPTHDTTGIKSAILWRQIKACLDSNPARKSQACLPIKVWLEVQGPQASAFHSAMGDLLTGSLFFAMHSCKYTTNNTTDGPKTKNTPNRVCRKYHSARNSHPPPTG